MERQVSIFSTCQIYSYEIRRPLLVLPAGSSPAPRGAWPLAVIVEIAAPSRPMAKLCEAGCHDTTDQSLLPAAAERRSVYSRPAVMTKWHNANTASPSANHFAQQLLLFESLVRTFRGRSGWRSSPFYTCFPKLWKHPVLPT